MTYSKFLRLGSAVVNMDEVVAVFEAGEENTVIVATKDGREYKIKLPEGKQLAECGFTPADTKF